MNLNEMLLLKMKLGSEEKTHRETLIYHLLHLLALSIKFSLDSHMGKFNNAQLEEFLLPRRCQR